MRVIAAAVILVFAAAACSDSTGASAATSREILFIGQDSPTFGLATIYAIRSDGTRLVKVTQGLGQAFYPRWSRDGRQIAYATGASSAAQVWVMNANGGGAHVVSDPNYSCAGYIRLTWSPTADRLLVDCKALQQFVIDLADRTSYSLTERWGNIAATPDWSPLGDKILYLDPSNVKVANLDGSGSVTVAQAGLQPQWSPDGTRIAFARKGATQTTAIFVANADGSDAHQITFPIDATVGDGAPAWSPDGTHLVFVRLEENVGFYGTSRLHVIEPTGANDVTVSPDTLWALRPDW
jgi:Tol biopolymer transport system component